MLDLLTMDERLARYWAKFPDHRQLGSDRARKLNPERVRFIRSMADHSKAKIIEALHAEYGVRVGRQCIRDVLKRITSGEVV